MRTKRTDGTDTYEYVYLDGQLVQLTVNDNGTEVLMKFAYDEDGVPLSITYKGTTYYYVTNVQGDVLGVVNQSGNLLLSYTYDAWGNILSVGGSNKNTMGKYNPLRYRGYVYDEGTGLYYLQSRYYDPEMGRFLNADGYVSTGDGLLGNNMYSYCGNNPVNRADPTGHFWRELWEAFTQNIQQASGYFAFAAGVSQLDTPALGLADLAAGALLLGGALVCAGIGIYQAAQAPTVSLPNVNEKSETTAIPKAPDSHVIFPVDPNTFNPVGLDKVTRDGTKNGGFISWMDPTTNTEVFRWDENTAHSNGPHYHINDPIYIKDDVHFYPKTAVPEPYATAYFPLG